MNRRRTVLLKAAMTALHFSGTSSLVAPLTRGVGVMFMLHRVCPAGTGSRGPNRILEVKPEFLDQTISLVVERGFDVLSLDDAHARLIEGDFDRPFACFTFDDGYRDNREFAYPIFRRHNLPFAIYVPTDFPDGNGDLWWLKLEQMLGGIAEINVRIDGSWRYFVLNSQAEKDAAFEHIYWWLRQIPEREARGIVAEMCAAHDNDMSSLCRDLIMDWDEIRELASDPLVTIGAHTRRHMALAKLTQSEVLQEIDESVRRIESELDRRVAHFSYPYGDPASAGEREFRLAGECGLKTAVTTRKGMLHRDHGSKLTALPRVSLNGDFQHARYVKVLLSRAPFALWNAAQGRSFAGHPS